jgi:hypothetical protein
MQDLAKFVGLLIAAGLASDCFLILLGFRFLWVCDKLDMFESKA